MLLTFLKMDPNKRGLTKLDIAELTIPLSQERHDETKTDGVEVNRRIDQLFAQEANHETVKNALCFGNRALHVV
jgi:hypothetical protein